MKILLSLFGLLVCTPVVLGQNSRPFHIDSIVQKMTLDEKLDYLSGQWKPHDRGTHELYACGNERLNIPAFKMEYVQQGVHTNGKSTLYPSALALAATFDTTVVREVARNIAMDCRCRGVNVAIAPELTLYQSKDMQLQSLTFGDNPVHAARIAHAFSDGLISQRIMPIGRYTANDNSDADSQNKMLGLMIQANCLGGIVVNGNSRGILASENKDFNLGKLREEMNFGGIILSDCWQTRDALAAFLGGICIDMPRGQWLNAKNLKPMVERGQISDREVDTRISLMLSTLSYYQLTQAPFADRSIPENRQSSSAQSLRAAQKAMTLLKNDNALLPIREKDRIFIIGNRVHSNSQADDTYSVYPFAQTTVADAFAKNKKCIMLSNPIEHLDLSSTGEFFSDNNRTKTGLQALYYNNKAFGNAPIHRMTECCVDYCWGKYPPYSGLTSEQYAIRWQGVYVPSEDKIIRFALSGKGHYRLYIDQILICDNESTSNVDNEVSHMCSVRKGVASEIRIEYVATAEDADIQFSYSDIAIADLQKQLKKADKIIVSIGSDGAYNSDIDFWIDYVSSFASKTIIVMQCCDVTSMSWSHRAAAVLQAWHTGESAGQAIHDILTGRISPSGKMPITTAEYPFGYGLTY